MKIQLVQIINGKWQVENLDASDPLAAMEIRGFTLAGFCNRRGLRPELQGQPQFNQLVGPMWGGLAEDGEPIVRYENQNANDQLSV